VAAGLGATGGPRIRLGRGCFHFCRCHALPCAEHDAQRLSRSSRACWVNRMWILAEVRPCCRPQRTVRHRASPAGGRSRPVGVDVAAVGVWAV